MQLLTIKLYIYDTNNCTKYELQGIIIIKFWDREIYVQRYTGKESRRESFGVKWSVNLNISIIQSHRCFQLGCLLSIQFVVMQLVLLVYFFFFFFFFLPLYLLLYTSFFFCWMLLYASVICLKWSFNLFIRYGWSKLIIAFLKKLYNVYGLRFWLLRLLYYYVYFLASCFHLMNLPNIFIFYHKYACMEEKGENLYCSVLSSRISSIWVKIIEG